MIYCPDYGKYFEDDGAIDDWIADMQFDIKDWTLGDTKFVQCRKRYLNQSFCISTYVDEYYNEQFEDEASLLQGALMELDKIFVDWCQRYDLHWFEPTEDPYEYAALAREEKA